MQYTPLFDIASTGACIDLLTKCAWQDDLIPVLKVIDICTGKRHTFSERIQPHSDFCGAFSKRLDRWSDELTAEWKRVHSQRR